MTFMDWIDILRKSAIDLDKLSCACWAR